MCGCFTKKKKKKSLITLRTLNLTLTSMNENIALSTRYPTAAGWDLLHKLENLGGNKDSLSDYTNGLFMVYYVIH